MDCKFMYLFYTFVICLFVGFMFLTKKEISITLIIIMLLFVVIFYLICKEVPNSERYDFFNRKRKEDNMVKLKEKTDSDFDDTTELENIFM